MLHPTAGFNIDTLCRHWDIHYEQEPSGYTNRYVHSLRIVHLRWCDKAGRPWSSSELTVDLLGCVTMQLHRLGREYPDPNYNFLGKLRSMFAKNAHLTDEKEIQAKLDLAEFIKNGECRPASHCCSHVDRFR